MHLSSAGCMGTKLCAPGVCVYIQNCEYLYLELCTRKDSRVHDYFSICAPRVCIEQFLNFEHWKVYFRSVRNWDLFSLARGTVGLDNLMKISLVLVNFSLAPPNFHWPRAPGQLLRSHTGLILNGDNFHKSMTYKFQSHLMNPVGRWTGNTLLFNLN